jgi:hypothetical protein
MTLAYILALFKGDPLLDVAGAYFPAWLASMLAGALGSWLVFVILERLGGRDALSPHAVFLPATFVAFTCTTWLVFFSAG